MILCSWTETVVAFQIETSVPFTTDKKSECVVSHFRLQIYFQTCCHHVLSHMFCFSCAYSHPSLFRLVMRCDLVLAYCSTREGLGYGLVLVF